MQSSILFHNLSMLMCCDAEDGSLGLRNDAALLVEKGRVAWIGAKNALPSLSSKVQKINVEGRLLTPGLVDAHAHPVFAGHRAQEFASRARGDHYLAIAKEGGGIAATVAATHAATHDELVSLCQARLKHALQSGTTTMEAKSGYDLRVEGELRLLRVIQEVSQTQAITLLPTLLGAHTLPHGYEGRRQDFIQAVVEQMIPQAAQLG